MKIAPWLIAAATKAVPYVAGAVVSGATSAAVASAKSKEAKRKAAEEKKQLALKEAAEGISTDIEGKTKLA